MKKNKNKIVIVLISVILVIGLLFLIGPHNKPYTGITYFARNERACLVFHKNGKYSMNNCDGEPTNYFFDDEHLCYFFYLIDYYYYILRILFFVNGVLLYFWEN